MQSLKTIYLDEPHLVFGDNQRAADPRDGLTLFGPYEKQLNYSVQAGVVGTRKGIELYRGFVGLINRPIISTKWSYQAKGQASDELQRPSFPGFEAVFGIHWGNTPHVTKEIPERQIYEVIRTVRHKKKRTSELVDLYVSRILEARNKEDAHANIWFIIVPKRLYTECRPMSRGKELSDASVQLLQERARGQQGLFNDEDYVEELQRIVGASSDFHHLLKARLIQEKVTTPVQIFVEPKLQFRDILTGKPYEPNIRAHMAWTLSTTLYYKLGCLPWRLAEGRDGVCYLGLVFKKTEDPGGKSACSAAQMFLKDGDGAVFRGNIGMWESEKPHEYHLDRSAANRLISMALDDYREKLGVFPREMFVHGRVEFSDDEWQGFSDATLARDQSIKLVGVVIKDRGPLKLFREAPGQPNKYGVLRGIALLVSDTEAYLNTRGFVPRLNTSLSMEIPNPLYVKVARGAKDLPTVLSDILALTKLNYNACIYGDGRPVTLTFSDNIGSILTATSQWQADVRQFKYYI